jgi:hypothetical protein
MQDYSERDAIEKRLEHHWLLSAANPGDAATTSRHAGILILGMTF